MIGLRRHRWVLSERCSIRFPFSSGTCFTAGALGLAGVALYFYTERNANRNCSSAESRDLNDECLSWTWDFYDNHDIWHLLSGTGIFMAFLALLTLDDNLMFVPRDEIPVI